jgi:Spy/CpxP family protein refolding chaperone
VAAALHLAPRRCETDNHPMKSNRIIIPLLVAILALTTVHAAEKEKRANISDYPFWTMKKRGAVPQLAPGLNAVLGLTDAQVQQIAAAREEMSNDEAVKAARSIPKSDPNVTAEQREKGRAAMEAASARLREKVAAILTAEQKTLIEKINAAYASAVEDTGVVYADKFASVKADEAARKRIQEEKNQDIEEQFFHKLDALLSPSQKEAMKRAAGEEQERNAKAATVKKPAK